MIPREPPPPDFDEPEAEAVTALDGTINAAEPADVKRQVKRQATRQRNTAEFWQAMLAGEEGRAELWKILELAGTFDARQGVSGNGGYDPTLTAFYQGQKSLGQHLFHTWLGYDRDGVLQMLIEHQKQAVEASKAKRAKKTPTAGFTTTKSA